MTREEAIKRLKEARNTIQPFRYVDEAIDYAIKALEQEPKTGHWIYEDVLYSRCSECGELAIIANWSKVLSDFCPNCGARMVEPQESEEV